MITRQFVVGNIGAPVAGQTTFTADFLGCCFVNFMIIDNIISTQLKPNPQFTHHYLENCINIYPNTFVLGSKIIFDITPVKPCFE